MGWVEKSMAPLGEQHFQIPTTVLYNDEFWWCIGLPTSFQLKIPNAMYFNDKKC